MDSGLIIFDNIQCELACLPNFLSETHYVQKITSSPSTLAPNTIDISILLMFFGFLPTICYWATIPLGWHIKC